MRVLTVAMVLLMSSALVPSFAEEEGKSPVPNQSSGGTQDSGISGDVTVREQAQKPASTTGTTSGTQDSGISGDLTVHEQEQKPASTTGTTKSR